MNLSGNVVNIITIFNLITVANENCDLNTIYFNSGRLFFRLSYVKPIEVVVRSSRLVQSNAFLTIAKIIFDQVKSFTKN
jgi:hypothetical protein